MKNIIIFIMLLSIFQNCAAQNYKRSPTDSILTFIRNNKIKYTFVLMSCDSCAPIKNIGYRVIVHLTQSQKENIKKINTKTWNLMLQKQHSDWATNLILYSLYDKDAFILSKNKNKNEWRKYSKQSDIDYWRDFFKNRLQ